MTAARNQLETSKRVRQLPATEQALPAGKLSGAKAEAIAAAAEVAPEAEADLLEGAEDAPLADVREQCLRARAKDRDAAHARIRKARSLKEFTDAEGGWNVVVRGPVEAGAAFRAAHRPIVEELFKTARAEGRREPYEAYAFDAFIELARRAAHGSTADQAATVEPDAATAPAPTKVKATPAGYLGIIRVDHTALRRGSVEGGEVCEIVGLGPIPVPVARELLGDAILKVVITKGVDVANVTHLGRSATVAQQVALWWKSAACTVSGCTRTQRLQKRPPLRMGQNKENTTRRARPALQTPPRPQNPTQLGTRRRRRPTTHGPTRRPPPPQTQARRLVTFGPSGDEAGRSNISACFGADRGSSARTHLTRPAFSSLLPGPARQHHDDSISTTGPDRTDDHRVCAGPGLGLDPRDHDGREHGA